MSDISISESLPSSQLHLYSDPTVYYIYQHSITRKFPMHSVVAFSDLYCTQLHLILLHWLSFCAFTVYCLHHSVATKLELAPVSITLSLFPSNYILITGTLSFLSSNSAIIRCSVFR